MPEIRYYTATQEREVKVWANSAVEAAQIAHLVFNGTYRPGDTLMIDNKDVTSQVRSQIRERSLDVREDR